MSKKVAQILHLWQTCTFSPNAVSTCFSQHVPKVSQSEVWSSIYISIYDIYWYLYIYLYVQSFHSIWGESGLGEEVFRWRWQRPAGHDAPDVLHRDAAQHPTKRCPGQWQRHRWRVHISLRSSWGEKTVHISLDETGETSQKHPKNIPKNCQDCWVKIENCRHQSIGLRRKTSSPSPAVLPSFAIPP